MEYPLIKLKRKKSQTITVIFLIIALANLIGEAFEIYPLIYCTKPLITISLLVLFLTWTYNRMRRFSIFIIVALLFSLVGDILLMFDSTNPQFFKLGLLAFLLAQVSYIGAFFNNFFRSKKAGNWTINSLFLILFSAFYFLMITYLSEHVDEGFGMIAFYGTAITTMGISAGWRYQKVEINSFIWILIGAILFMISDSIIGYNQFIAGEERIPAMRILIMSTYIVAQFLIVIGAIEHIKWVRPKSHRKF